METRDAFCYKNDVHKLTLHRKHNRPSEANKTTSSLSQNPEISMNILIYLKTENKARSGQIQARLQGLISQ